MQSSSRLQFRRDRVPRGSNEEDNAERLTNNRNQNSKLRHKARSTVVHYYTVLLRRSCSTVGGVRIF